jgi:hypothetical protein
VLCNIFFVEKFTTAEGQNTGVKEKELFALMVKLFTQELRDT